MWRHLLCLVCLIEAAALATILVAIVVQPDLIGVMPTPRIRQLCAIGAVVFVVGSAKGVMVWIRHLATKQVGLTL